MSDTTSNLTVTTNEGNGTLYAVVTLGSGTPTGAQIKAGQDSNGSAAAFATNQAVSSSGVRSITATGLTPETAYYAHFVQEDAALNQSNVVTSAVFTTQILDVVAPTVSVPAAAESGDTTAALSVSTNENSGVAYWVVTESATTPTAAQVKAGQDHTSAAAADGGTASVSSTGTQNIVASGLAPDTAYFAHFVHEDAALNQSNVVSSSTFTTQSAGSASAIIQNFLGPIASMAAVNGQGGDYALWASTSLDYADAQHTNFGSGNDVGHAGAVYDRPMFNYVLYVMTGDSKYLTRAHAGVVGYRDAGYDHPNEPNRQFTSPALHYLITGDSATLSQIGAWADYMCGLVDGGYINSIADTSPGSDPNGNSARCMAHALTAFVAAWYTNAPSVGSPGGYPGGKDHGAYADAYVDTILGTMSADGGHRFWQDTRYTYGYQIGLLDDALEQFYLLKANPTRKAAIVAVMKKRHEFIWTTLLDQFSHPYTLMYLEGPNPRGGESTSDLYNPPGFYDLAPWLCGSCGFLYYVTGDPTYLTRGLQLLHAGFYGNHDNVGAYLTTTPPDPAGSVQGIQHKIFSEITRTSWRLMAWALITPLATPTVPVNSVLPVISGPVGLVYTCTTGAWSNNPSSFNYAWCKRPTGGGVNTVLQFGSNANYTSTGDGGSRLFCLVTASNGSGPGIIARAIESAVVP